MFKKEYGVKDIEMVTNEERKIEAYILKKIENAIKILEKRTHNTNLLVAFNPLTANFYYRLSFIFLANSVSKFLIFRRLYFTLQTRSRFKK